MENTTSRIKFPQFIGRQVQMEQVRKVIIGQTQGISVINIAGVGGIGKTAILRQIQKEFQPDSNKLVTDIIDFSHTVHRVESWILEQVVAVAPEKFSLYRSRIKAVELATDPLSRQQREKDALDGFRKDCAKIAKHYRFVLLFDTMELVQETPLVDFILDLASQMENVVLVTAGRRNAEAGFLRQLRRVFRRESILTMPLSGFSETESAQYFGETKTPHLKEVDENLRRNIYLLSEGNPIKIALSLDWLDRGITIMPELRRLQPEAAARLSKKELARLKYKFENSLMAGIRQLKSPADKLILYMAHFNKRFNVRLLQFFFPDLDVDETLSFLKELPFVKYTSDHYFVLHDEMNRMVQKYIWDTVEDPLKIRRRELSQRICEHYQKELERREALTEHSEQEIISIWSYRVELAYYKLYADFETGYHYFEQLFEKLDQDRRPGLAAMLVNFVREFQGQPQFSDLLKCFVEGYYSGGVLILEKKFAEAEKILREGEQKFQVILSNMDWEAARSLEHYLRRRQYLLYNQLGFCYRSLGDWENAKANYQKALDFAMGLLEKDNLQSAQNGNNGSQLLEQTGGTLNNLANVHRLAGEFYDAHIVCQTSIYLRLAQKQDAVMSRYVMAMILWEMGATAEAVTSLRKAEQNCPDENRRAMLKKYRAYLFFRTGQYEQAQAILDEVEAVFVRTDNLAELVDVYNYRCRLYREEHTQHAAVPGECDCLEKARKFSEQACQISKEIDDNYRLAESYLTRALLNYQVAKLRLGERNRKEIMSDYEKGYELSNKYNYLQLCALYDQLRGDIAFDDGEYEQAFKYYIRQCERASHFKYAAYERSIDHVGDKLRALGDENPALAQKLIRDIAKQWQTGSSFEQYQEFVEELQDVGQAVEEKDRIRQLKIALEQAQRAGRWGDAKRYSQEILKIPGLYSDTNRAEIILDESRAAHREENLPEARRLAKVAFQIGKDVKDEKLIGEASLALTAILWDMSSTAEAATYLKNAEAIFQKLGDEVGLAKARRYSNYFLYRTGVFTGRLEAFAELAQVFDRHKLYSEAADVKNTMSRVARTNPYEPDYGLARKYAEQALETARLAQDAYRLAECFVSLAILSYCEEKYSQVLEYCQAGLGWLPETDHSMRAVYEGIQGAALYEQGLRAAEPAKRASLLEQAFLAFSNELIQSSHSKPASLARTIGLLFEKLMRLPTLADAKKYVGIVTGQVATFKNLRMVDKLGDYVIRYYPYIHQDKS